MTDKQYQEIPIDQIVIPEDRARATFTPGQEKELRASIKEHGFTVPILVRPLADGRYELIDGEHRISIVKDFGWDRIPAIVSTTDEKKANVLNFLANTARGAQDPMGVARQVNKAIDSGLDLEEVAAATGHTKEWAEFYKHLLELPEHYQKALEQGALNVTAVKEAFRLPNWEETDKTLRTAIQLGWPATTVKRAVDGRLEELERAEARREELREPEETPEYQPEEQVRYERCFACDRTVERDTTQMEILCQDCRYLLSYLLDNLGNPKDALDTCYKALKEYKERQKYEEYKEKFEPEQKRPPRPRREKRPKGTSSFESGTPPPR